MDRRRALDKGGPGCFLRRLAPVMLVVLLAIWSVGQTGCSTDTTGTSEATETTAAADKVLAWTEIGLSGPVPDPRSGSSMVYAAAPTDVTGSVILFGGWDPDTDFGDTWKYDVSADSWTMLEPTGQTPAPRALHHMVYDSGTGRVILFGGTSDAGRYGDTWAYDPAGNAWTHLALSGGPSRRSALSMVYDQESGRVILFGGNEGETRYGDTWAYDPGADAWTDLQPTGQTPSGRSAHAMAYDPLSGRVILFGGYDGTLLNDTWAYDPGANTWTRLDPAGDVPSPRGNHRMVYDPSAGVVVLFGGYDGATELNDTWAYDPAANTWTQLEAVGSPPPGREQYGMAYVPAQQGVLIFGGLDSPADLDLNDTWALGDLLER